MTLMSADQAHLLVTGLGDSSTAVILRETRTANPLDPGDLSSTYVSHEATVAPDDVQAEELERSLVLAGDRILSVSPRGLSIALAVGDRIVEGTTKAAYDALGTKPLGRRIEHIRGTEAPLRVILR